MVSREGVQASRDSNQSGVLPWPGANSCAGAPAQAAGAGLASATMGTTLSAMATVMLSPGDGTSSACSGFGRCIGPLLGWGAQARSDAVAVAARRDERHAAMDQWRAPARDRISVDAECAAHARRVAAS